MKKNLILIISLFSISLSWSQTIERYDDYDDFESTLMKDPDVIYVVNFWATWCAPCVKELPYFELLNQEHQRDDVVVVLVSIDFKNQYERRLQPFLKKKQYTSRLIHMSDPKTNEWVPKVDSSWDGSIPATLYLSGSKRQFVEKAYETYDDLDRTLEAFIQL